jgi:hypothetical protein
VYADQTITDVSTLSNKTLTITGYGTTPKEITHSAPGALFGLSGSDSLILDGYITLNGQDNDNSPYSLVEVSGGTPLEMKGHAKITGCITGDRGRSRADID